MERNSARRPPRRLVKFPFDRSSTLSHEVRLVAFVGDLELSNRFSDAASVRSEASPPPPGPPDRHRRAALVQATPAG